MRCVHGRCVVLCPNRRISERWKYSVLDICFSCICIHYLVVLLNSGLIISGAKLNHFPNVSIQIETQSLEYIEHREYQVVK